MPPKSGYASMPLGVVVRRVPGATRWARWSHTAVAVLPHAPPADWRVLREEDGATEYHAATRTLELFHTDTEAYAHGLGARQPSVWAVLREGTDGRPLDVVLVTASPYEAQDYLDNGEDIVERIVMPPGLLAWVAAFVDVHHEETPFKKRRRDRRTLGEAETGRGDPRVRQAGDVYRAPTRVTDDRVPRRVTEDRAPTNATDDRAAGRGEVA